MNKKELIFVTFPVLTVLALGIAVGSNNQNESLRSRANLDPYVFSVSDCSDLTNNEGIANSVGYRIKFSSDDFSNGVLGSEHYLFNKTAITGIQTISVDASADIVIYAAVCNGEVGDVFTINYDSYVNGSGTVVADFSAFETDYFAIYAPYENVTLSNLVVNYSCKSPKTHDLTINVKTLGTSLSGIKLVYDLNYNTHTGNLFEPQYQYDPIQEKNVFVRNNIKETANVVSMEYVSEGNYYTYTFEDYRFSDIRFEFVDSSGSYLISAFASTWYPYELFLKEDKTLYCTVNGFPAFDDRTTVFSVSEKAFGSGDLKTVTIYSSNDFHGYVDEESNRAGLLKFGSYFKEKGEDGNTLLLDQGDTWQGTFNSNYNYGNIVTDVMNYAHFDARTVGNHDFDWTIQKILDNNVRKYPMNEPSGYTTPALCANVYDYDFEHHVALNTRREDIGVNSVSYQLDNGLRVGIVGVIGDEQITSINSLYMHDVTFKDHIKAIQDEATALRNDPLEPCDIVICSLHGGQEDVMRNGLENYVDLVLCSHTHKIEFGNEGKLNYLQFGRNGENFGHITLTYDTETKEIGTAYRIIPASEVKAHSIDPTIQDIYDSYVVTQNYNSISGEVLHQNSTGTFASGNQLPRLASKISYDYAMETLTSDQKNGLIGAMTNYARSNLSGQWTYGDVYSAFPFLNEMYVVEAPVDELVNELGHNFYYVKPGTTLVPGQRYKVLVNDYIFYHMDKYHNYNYFPQTAPNYVTKLNLNLRECIVQYLRDNGYADGTKTLDPSDYLESVEGYNSSAYTVGKCSVTFKVEGQADLVKEIDYNATWASNLPATPTKAGYYFVGWEDANHDLIDETGKCQSSYTLTAVFEEITQSTTSIEFRFNYWDVDGKMGSGATLTSGNFSASLTFTNATDSQTYRNITLNGGGSILVSAPSGYKIRTVKTAHTYNDQKLKIYKGNDADPSKEINPGFNSGDVSTYEAHPNDEECLISATKKSYVRYVYVTIEKVIEAIGPYEFVYVDGEEQDVLRNIEGATDKTRPLTVEGNTVQITASEHIYSTDQYSNITLCADQNDYLEITAPDHYVISSVHVHINHSHDNLAMIAGNHTSESYIMDTGFETDGSTSTYDFNPNNRICTIKNPSGYNVYLYSVTVYIIQSAN